MNNLLSINFRDLSWVVPTSAPLVTITHLDNVSVVNEKRWVNELSIDERNQYASFRFKKDSKAYAVSRGIMRKILASFFDVPTHIIQFKKNCYGKPELCNKFRDVNVPYFNWAHSGNWIIASVSRNRTGVDIEDIGVDIEIFTIAKMFFSENEQKQLRDTDFQERRELFFQFWTLKESFVKGIGLGLQVSLKDFWFEKKYKNFHLRTNSGRKYIADNNSQNWRFFSDKIGESVYAIAWEVNKDDVLSEPVIHELLC